MPNSWHQVGQGDQDPVIQRGDDLTFLGEGGFDPIGAATSFDDHRSEQAARQYQQQYIPMSI